LVLSTNRDGGLNVQCPWHAGHSTGSDDDGSTTYFSAGTRGYPHGAFNCLHGSCSGRTTLQFSIAVGYTKRPTPEEDFGAFDDAEISVTALTKSGPRPLRAYLPHEVQSLPPAQWRIRGVLPKNGIGMLYGQSGSGKSFVTLDMMLAVARGVEWQGQKVDQGGVLYVAAEGDVLWIHSDVHYCPFSTIASNDRHSRTDEGRIHPLTFQLVGALRVKLTISKEVSVSESATPNAKGDCVSRKVAIALPFERQIGPVFLAKTIICLGWRMVLRNIYILFRQSVSDRKHNLWDSILIEVI